MEAHRIVIVGAGFAGLRTALELAKRRARLKQSEITLIDRNAAHVYTPLLYEVASGELDEPSKACVGELRSGVCVQFEEYVNIVKKKNIRFRRDEVVGIDAEEKIVRTKSGEAIAYDDLVIATGTETATYGVPGVAEHARAMKTLRDAFHVRERVYSFIRAYKAGTEARISIVVAGGGATGVEFASETAHFFQRLVAIGIVQTADYRITLVESAPDVLLMFPPYMRAKARERLVRLGVTVRTETKLKEAKAGSVVLAGVDGTAREEDADVVVWAAGIKPLASAKEWGLPVDEKGYVKIDATFAVEGMKNVHALGDCVSIIHPKTKAKVPALAQVAVREAGIVAENIARHLERKMPMSWTPPERWVTVVPMGGRYALADFGWFQLCDGPAYVARKAADLLYFLSILPPREAWKMWREGARAYYKND